MKYKFLLLIAVILAIVTILSGCADVWQTQDENSRFVVVEEADFYEVVRDKYTGVMYAVSRAVYNCGNFTALITINS